MYSAAPRFGVFDRTTLIDFHFTSRFSCTRRWSNTILNFGSHSHESLFDISCIFGGCLKEWNAQLIGIFLYYEIKREAMREETPQNGYYTLLS